MFGFGSPSLLHAVNQDGNTIPAETPNPICLRAILRFTTQLFGKSSIARILGKYKRFSAYEFKSTFKGQKSRGSWTRVYWKIRFIRISCLTLQHKLGARIRQRLSG